jgi:UDP-N-acetylglucosamine 2-epimerase (non-hydrolysing)
MSGAFFDDLGLPAPDIQLGVGSGSHAEQTAGIMTGYERVLFEARPDWVVVVGDVNSTLACTLTAKKLDIPVAHLEAGLRSFDRTMPEEINRVVTDALADLLWTPSPDGDENLIKEGISPERIVRVGNIMIDCLIMLRPKVNGRETWKEFDLSPREYGLVTLHRPSNVDVMENMAEIRDSFTEITRKLPLVFPMHPRTRKQLETSGLWSGFDALRGLHVIEPLNYISFMSLVTQAGVVITDSGGLQEETTWLDIPCLTLRDTTERPITVTMGTNQLIRRNELAGCVDRILEGKWKKGRRPELWDGRTAERTADSLKKVMPGDPFSWNS